MLSGLGQIQFLLYIGPVRNILFVISLLSPVTLLSQIIDLNNFDEDNMNKVMFSEMNEYVKITHNGDSLIHSEVIQTNIMPRNYNLIKTNHHLPLRSLHNQEWINERTNELPDTLKKKIIDENANPKLLESIFLKDFNVFAQLFYIEILQSSSYLYNDHVSYEEVAKQFIRNWNTSPPHAAIMNANYRSKVIVGVTTFYDLSTRTVFISFVYVS